MSLPRAGGRWLGPTGVTRGNGSGPCLFRSGRHKGLSLSPPSARGSTKAWVYHRLCVCRGRFFLEAAQGLGYITASVPRFKYFHSLLGCAISRAGVRDSRAGCAISRAGSWTSSTDIPVKLECQSDWNVSWTGMPVQLAFQSNWHSSPTDNPVQLTFQSNWHSREDKDWGYRQRFEFITTSCIQTEV